MLLKYEIFTMRRNSDFLFSYLFLLNPFIFFSNTYASNLNSRCQIRVAMQIEKLLKSDCFTSLKQVLKFRNPTIYKFVGLHPGRIVFPFLIYFLTFSTAFSIWK